MPSPFSTRFAGWGAWPSRLMLAALALLVVAGFQRELPAEGGFAEVLGAGPSEPQKSDADLYRAVADRVTAGEGYYEAVVAEHVARGYPVQPSVAVRMPTLAYVEAASGPVGTRVLLAGLAALAWFAFRRRCAREPLSPTRVAAVSVLTAAGLAPMLNAQFVLWHETWAGGLILLSLALRSRDRFVAAVGVGLAAAAIRELAIPYLGAMAVLAFVEGHRREAAAWSAAVAAALACLAAHAWALSGHIQGLDMHSPGWVGFGGWSFVLEMMKTCTMMVLAPAPVIAVCVPLCLLGWLAWPGPLGARGAFTLMGYCAAFTVLGRPDNSYWGIVIAPLLFPGLAFAPAALRDLVRAALSRRPVPQPA